MVEYVKEQDKIEFIAYDNLWEKVINFANFLSQQPNIGMFVPAVFEDGEWRVLSKPIFDFNNEYDGEKRREFAIALKEFETALDNVIFEGFEVDFKTSNIIAISNVVYNIWFYKNGIVTINSQVLNTIEQLTSHNLTLTPKFAKELGLI
jgi:hypothetical protein